MPPGIGWKRFDHFCVAVPDAEEATAFYQKLFGIEIERRFSSEAEGFRGTLLQMPDRQGQIEVMQGLGDDSFLERFLARNGAGLHHITIEVEDVDTAVRYLREEMGIEPHRGVFNDHQWKQTFIHPRDAGGVLYQLFEWLPGKGPSTDAE